MPALFKTSLADGLATVERWAKTLPANRRAEGVHACHIHAIDRHWSRSVTFEVPTTASPFFADIAEQLEGTRDDDERIPLGQLPDRLVLQPQRAGRAADTLLILLEGLDSSDIAETMLGLASVSSADQVVHRLQFNGVETVRGVEMHGVLDPQQVLDRTVTGSVHQVRYIGSDRFVTPHGLVHPLAEMCPTVLLAISGSGDLHLWRESSLQRATGSFQRCKLLSSEPRLPADLFEVTDSLAKTQPVQSSAEPPAIPIHMVSNQGSGEPEGVEVGSVIIEVQGSNAGRAKQSLLDLLDEVESGILDDETTIWSSRSGASEISPTTYHIWFRSERSPEDLASTGARVFVQPRAYEDCGIPLFVEHGSALRPPLERVYDVVGKDHRVFNQLRSRFPAQKDGGPCRHLLRRNPHGDPSHLVLEGGERLIDLIDEIVLATHAVPIEARSSTDSREGDRMATLIADEKEATDQRLALAGNQASESIRTEFQGVLADLERITAQMDLHLQGLKQRVDLLQTITQKIDQAVAAAPRTWWALSDPVNQVDRKILEERDHWLRKIDAEGEIARENVEALRNRIEDATRLVDTRLQKIESLEESAKKARTEFDNRIESAEKTRRRLVETVKDAEELHNQAESTLNAVGRSCDAEAKRLKNRADRLAVKRRELEATQRDQEIKRQQLDSEQQKTAARANQLAQEKDQLIAREKAIKAEIARLDHLEKSEIPSLERSIEGYAERLGRIDKVKLEQRAARLSGERERLRLEWEAYQARFRELDQQSEALGATRQEQGQRRQEIEAKHSEISQQARKLKNDQMDLDRREAEAKRRLQALNKAAGDVARQRGRVNDAEDAVNRKRRGRSQGGIGKWLSGWGSRGGRKGTK